jgi:adenylosuccinate synthase
MRKGKLNVVFGGQAGSEAKGKMGAYLADKFGIRVFAGSFSPNAGHTVIKGGMKSVTYHVPASIYGVPEEDRRDVIVILGPESVINPSIFLEEVERMEAQGFDRTRILLDARAAIITQGMVREEEKSMTGIGSTAQGVGIARCKKLMRTDCIRAVNIPQLRPYTVQNARGAVLDNLEEGETVLYEMTQGFDLCMAHGVDPVYCTSRIISPQMALAEMGIPANWLGDTYAVIRTYPIRVNNRTGTSGPYPSEEINWEIVRARCGAPMDITEITTTTKLVRRVFEFSVPRIQEMVEVCNPGYLCLQFLNYLNWADYKKTKPDTISMKSRDWIGWVRQYIDIPFAYLGTGPNHEDMIDVEVDHE